MSSIGVTDRSGDSVAGSMYDSIDVHTTVAAHVVCCATVVEDVCQY